MMTYARRPKGGLADKCHFAPYQLLDLFYKSEKSEQRFIIALDRDLRAFLSNPAYGSNGWNLNKWISEMVESWMNSESRYHAKELVNEFRANLEHVAILASRLQVFNEQFPARPYGFTRQNSQPVGTAIRKPIHHSIESERFKSVDLNERIFLFFTSRAIREFFYGVGKDFVEWIELAFDSWLTYKSRGYSKETVSLVRNQLQSFLDLLDTLRDLHEQNPVEKRLQVNDFLRMANNR